MKYILLISIFFSSAGLAQPVITYLNIPDSTTTVSLSTCQNSHLIISPPGPNQIWDYTALDSCNSQPLYNISFFGTTPSSYQTTYFDTANIVTDQYVYYQVNQNYFREFGREPFSYIISTNDPRDILRLPMNYLDSFSDYHSFSVTAYNAGGNTLGNSTVVADAWGTLITNGITLNDVLRICTHTITNGSYVGPSGPYYNHSNSFVYSFYSASIRYPVLEISTDSIGNITYTTYQDFLNPVIESRTNSFPEITPNPSNGNFLISNPGNDDLEITLYNSTGELIYTNRFISEEFKIDMSKNPHGIYFYKINNSASIVKTGKLVIF